MFHESSVRDENTNYIKQHGSVFFYPALSGVVKGIRDCWSMPRRLLKINTHTWQWYCSQAHSPERAPSIASWYMLRMMDSVSEPWGIRFRRDPHIRYAEESITDKGGSSWRTQKWNRYELVFEFVLSFLNILTERTGTPGSYYIAHKSSWYIPMRPSFRRLFLIWKVVHPMAP